ncbi:MAG: hypothetical protein ACRDFA_07725, partial [bacterium]
PKTHSPYLGAWAHEEALNAPRCPIRVDRARVVADRSVRRVRPGVHFGRGTRHLRAVLPGVTVEAASPALIEKVRSV